MTVGRIVATTSTVLVMGGCAVLVVGMAQADPGRAHHRIAEGRLVDGRPSTSIPAQLPVATASTSAIARTRARSVRPAPVRSTAPATSRPATPTVTHALVTTAAVVSTVAPAPTTSAPTRHVTRAAATTTAAATHTATPAAAPRRWAAPKPRATAAQRGGRLPVSGYTGRASRVVTVRAFRASSTTAMLRTYRKASGGGWIQVGRGVTAHIGADGMSRYPSESRSATPIGSYTLTQAFGAYGNPGTNLPYFKTNAADWWISQSGPLYNTHQRCWSNCAFTRGSPNEHLRYETPYYNYAVVIDYNTRNSPTGVRQGRGSAFFLHVHPAGTGATAGCVSIPQGRLVTIMKWLRPRTHPRILIGTG